MVAMCRLRVKTLLCLLGIVICLSVRKNTLKDVISLLQYFGETLFQNEGEAFYKFSSLRNIMMVVKNGFLHLCGNHLLYSWASLMRLSRDCTEQNVELTRNREGGVCLRMTCNVVAGNELFVWYGVDLLSELEVPFLTPSNIRGDQAYICHNCQATFLHPNPLKAHLVMECQAYPKNQRELRDCDYSCQTGFSEFNTDAAGISSYYTNQKNEGKMLVASPDERKGGHVCVYCGKVYSRRYGLKIHVRTHTGYKPLKCQICMRPFSDPSNLNKHVRLHGDSDTPYRCRYCGKVLVRRRDLQRHLKSRHGGVEDSKDKVKGHSADEHREHHR